MDISALPATPSGRILVVILWRDYTCIKMFDIEGQHLSDLEVPPGKHDVATANDEEAILLLSEQSKVLILDIRTNELSVKQTIELDEAFNAEYVTTFKDKIVLSCWCYPTCVKMIDRAGKVLWSSSIDDTYYTPFKSASCIVSFFEDNKPNVIVGDVPFLRQGLVKLDAETGLLLKVKRSNNILPLGMELTLNVVFFTLCLHHVNIWCGEVRLT